MLHPSRDADVAHHVGEFARIEVIGVPHFQRIGLVAKGARPLVGAGQIDGRREHLGEITGPRPVLQKIIGRFQATHGLRAGERIDVVYRLSGLVDVPVGKEDSELEGRVAGLEERAFGNACASQRAGHARHGGLSHADCGHVGRLDQGDRHLLSGPHLLAEIVVEDQCRHPAGCPAPDDGNGIDRLSHAPFPP